MPRLRRAPAMLIAGALAFVPLGASASPPAQDDAIDEPVDEQRVLIRVLPDDKRVAARLRAELGVIGLDAQPIDVAADAPTLGPELLDQLESTDASAAIEIAMSEDRIDVWVADGATGKTLNRRFDLALDPSQAEPRTLAIAAVELLRASRLEIDSRPDPVEDPAEDTPGPTEQVDESERPPDGSDVSKVLAGTLSLAPMLGGSPGGLGLNTHIEIAGRWVPLRRFALRASVWVPSLGNRVSGEQGVARVFVAMAFVEPQLRLPGGAPWFHPELGLGLGGALVIIQGQANMGFRNSDAILGGFAGFGHLGLGFQLSARLWVRVDGYVGIVQPQPRVVFVDEVVAVWGLPFGTGSLGLEMWF